MGEIKSVKVDNWGVFFLQKLQNFFNKTDYCDLTLQFNDNSQLKVHRLVLSACTDFFNVLEQSCEMIDDVLIMPPELQADVVVPIVNFMYTGTLEFELIMYGRLLKTAKDMNMTVLLKLLEAHRRTMENKSQVNKTIQKVAPKQVRRNPYNTSTKVVEERKYITQSQSTSTSQQRRTPAVSTVPKYKTLQIKPVSQNIFPRMLSEPAQILSKYPHSKTPVKGPSRFDCAEDTLPPETFEKSFDNISYESKPLICKEEPDAYDYDNLIRKHETYASPFEQLRRSYTNVNNKRPASSLSSYESPPEKKPNIQDVKEYAEQQRMRKQIAEEFDDDQEYDDTLDDEFHNDDDDDEYIPPQSVRKQVKQQQQQFRAQQQAKQAQQQKTGQHTVQQIHKTSPKSDNSPRATIVVKDSTSKSLNHAKVICEVLRKYPHIVKNNKSIKLKVMPQSNNAQKIVIKKEIDTNELQVEEKQPAPVAAVKQPVPSTSTSNAAPSATVATAQPRRIDSKTMHALIAMGAENKAGPWLCLRCGVNGRPISIPSYRGFRRHLINVHKEKIDPRLCEHCGWRSTNNKDLAHHLLVEHSVKTEHTYNFPKCEYCNKVCIDYDTLNKHITAKHSVKKEPQACIYCNVSFGEEMQLYTHMRSFHKQRAIEDGVLDFSDEDMSIEDANEVNMQDHVSNDSRINIISDISLSKNLPIIQATAIPANGSTITIQPAAATTPLNAANLNIIENTTEEESQMLTNEFIGTDSSQGPKFINAQGTEMELTPAQREEIISQLDQQHDGIVMVLNEEPFEANVATTASARAAQNNVAESTSSEPVADNSMFIVCGQEPDMENEISMPASLDRAKSKSKDPLEWVEEEIASHTDSVEKETKNDENENEIAKENSEDDAQEKSSEAEPATEGKVKEKEDEVKEEQEEVLSPKVASEKPVEDSLEMKLKLLTDWTDDEEEDEDDPEKGKPSQSSNVEEEKITSEEKLFETLTKDDGPTEDSAKASVKEKKLEAEVLPNVDPEVEEEDGDKMQEDEDGSADIEKEEEKEASPVPEEHEDEDEEDEADESKDEEIKEGEGVESQEDEPAEDQETHEPEEKSTEDWEKKEDSKKDSENAASSSKDDKEERTLITRAELRNIMSDWGDDEEEEV